MRHQTSTAAKSPCFLQSLTRLLVVVSGGSIQLGSDLPTHEMLNNLQQHLIILLQHHITVGETYSPETSGSEHTFSLADHVERAVYDVVQAEVGVLFLLALRVGVRSQKQRLVLDKP